MEAIVSVLERAGRYLSLIRPMDVLDVAIIAYLVYKILCLVRSTRAENILKGVAIFLVALWLSSPAALNLRGVNYILSHMVEWGVLALIILFQPEIRQLLEKVGSRNIRLLRIFQPEQQSSELERAIDQTVVACTDMAKTRTGVLIVFERKLLLENVMKVAKGKLTIIAHVACNGTRESMELAAHAESLGVDAIASIPPIYFHLPDAAIAKYWNDISSAAPNTDFIIYNIPQLAGVALNPSLLATMLENPRCIGVKNSSMPVEDIEKWIHCGAKVVFNGPDEQLLGGLVSGATGAIGGTYGAMPEVYLKIFELAKSGKDLDKARELQQDACQIIYKMCSGKGNMYAMIKEILRQTGGPDIGGVREPLLGLQEGDKEIAKECVAMISAVKAKL